MRQAEKCPIMALPMTGSRTAEDIQYRAVEPLLAGDRLREKRVAGTHNPLQSEDFEVSLS
jgi:hypothetical protein